jgi:hypothetical protein
MKKQTEALTGEDAWLAAKRAVAKRNEEARGRAAERRIPHEARAAAQRIQAARQERADLPEPPASAQA